MCITSLKPLFSKNRAIFRKIRHSEQLKLIFGQHFWDSSIWTLQILPNPRFFGRGLDIYSERSKEKPTLNKAAINIAIYFEETSDVHE